MEPRDFLLTWFEARTGRKLSWDADQATDFYAAKWIDSLAALDLIEACERELRVRFTEEDMADPGFATMGGLERILLAKRT